VTVGRSSRALGRAKARKLLPLVFIPALPFLVYYGWQSYLAHTRFNIYVLCGSTAKGTPYDPTVDLGKLVGYFFDGRIAGKPVRVINLAEGGGSAALAHDRSRKIPRGADLVLFYSGNNEFLRFDQDRDLSERPLLLRSARSIGKPGS